MQVELLTSNIQINHQLDAALKMVSNCYGSNSLTMQKLHKYGRKHRTILELFNLQFQINGISYLSHVHLIRHRLTTPMVQSQRFTETNSTILPYDLPDPFEFNITFIEEQKRKKLFDAFGEAYHKAYNIYKDLIEAGATKEQARYFAPQGAAINVSISMNLREFLYIYETRTAKNVLAETRAVIEAMMECIVQNEVLVGFVK